MKVWKSSRPGFALVVDSMDEVEVVEAFDKVDDGATTREAPLAV